ncbi:hypothetical protein NDU88_009627 [Pleurodeles waltl]|uniref:Uncharacterized protein n=1 Tax=Pleurodeles waltl TaxID=8319 RepID=A0AAV7RZK0_PLEWA|nr:hypothetical protein NDU88_009627 [Pleurodeles waltl]
MAAHWFHPLSAGLQELKRRGPGDQGRAEDRGGRVPGGSRRRSSEARKDSEEGKTRRSIENPRGRRPNRTENQHGPNLG